VERVAEEPQEPDRGDRAGAGERDAVRARDVLVLEYSGASPPPDRRLSRGLNCPGDQGGSVSSGSIRFGAVVPACRRLAGAATAAIGVAVLAGWALDLAPVVHLVRGGPAMSPLTALTMLLHTRGRA
jgi:hypothetical protein